MDSTENTAPKPEDTLENLVLAAVKRAEAESATGHRNFTRFSLVAELCEEFCRRMKENLGIPDPNDSAKKAKEKRRVLIAAQFNFRESVEQEFLALAKAGKISLEEKTGTVKAII